MKTLKETINHILKEELSPTSEEIGSFAADFGTSEIKSLSGNLSKLGEALSSIGDMGDDPAELEDLLNDTDITLDEVIPQLDEMLSASRMLRKLVTKELTNLSK